MRVVDNARIVGETEAVNAFASSLMRQRLFASLVVLAVAVLGAVPFLPAWHGPFLVDDQLLIAADPRVHDLTQWRRWFLEDFWNVPHVEAQFMPHLHYWRPLVTASFAFDAWRGAGGTEAFHTTNFVFHGVATALTYLLLRALSFRLPAALLGSLACAWHPAKTESVAWRSGRTDIICVIGVLLVMLADRVRKERRAVAVLLGVVGTVIAFLSKETAIALPLLLLAMRAIAEERGLERGTVRGSPLRSLFALVSEHRLILFGFGALSLAYLAARQRFLPMTPDHAEAPPFVAHFALVAESFGRFVELAFVPDDVSMMRAMLRTSAGGIVVSLPFAILGLASAIAVCVSVFAAHRHRLIVGTVVLFVVPLLPCINIVMTGMSVSIAPRFLYLPLLAIAVLVAFVAERAPLPRHRSMVALGASALAFATLGRSSDYRSADTFWDAEARSAPDSPGVHRAFIHRYAAEHRFRKELDEALRGYADAQRSYAGNGRDDMFFVQVLEAAAKLVPDHAQHELEELARFLFQLRRREPARPLDLPSAHVKLGLQAINPEYYLSLRSRLANLEAATLVRLGRDEEAVGLVRETIDGCAYCTDILMPAAYIAARVGALSIVEGIEARVATPLRPELARLRSQVVEDALVTDARGRAEVLRNRSLFARAVRAFEEGGSPTSPTERMKLAELRALSGDRRGARTELEALGRTDIDSLLEGWDASRGWAPER